MTVQLNVGRNNFGPVDPNNPSKLLFYPDSANHDGVGIGTDALTVWIFGTYLMPTWRLFPKVLIGSPTKRCG